VIDRTAAASVAAAMLHALFPERDGSAVAGLAEFQQDAVTRINAIFTRYGGALLCDSVGLGKTHVAAAICADVLRRGGSVLLAAPSQLRTHWSHQLRAEPQWCWASHATLSRSHTTGRLFRRSFDLVVVDEAHAFRNAATRRYRALARVALCARVLLITATPVNNSLRDFENLVRLFAGDDAFAEIGVPSLHHAVHAAREGSARELRRIAQHVMVRRTRDIVTRWSIMPSELMVRPRAGAGSADVPALKFPRTDGTELIPYDLDETFGHRIDVILDAIAGLRFAAHGGIADATCGELMRLGLIKRLESSQAAFTATVARLERLNATFIAAANEGRHFDARRDRGMVLSVGGSLQLSMTEITLPAWPARMDRTRALSMAVHDRALLHVMLESTRAAAGSDHKLATLNRVLATLPAEDRIIVFSEYRDTAAAIWKALERIGGVALVHGGAARLGRRPTTRRAVIERFAPVASRGARRTRIDIVRVLVATDVLAEGLNLQTARVVISYDIPWNPVRLAQRAGRIDRLGSPHEYIRVLAFRPGHGVERVLGLMRRVRSKLRAIRVVGGDAPAPFPRRNRGDRIHVDAREIARIEFLRRQPPPGEARRAVCAWSEPVGAVLCCVRLPGGAALVLVRDDGAASVDSDAAWRALTLAFTQPADAVTAEAFRRAAEGPATPALFVEAEDRALRIAAAARAAAPTPDAVRLRAARLVRTWLVTRPGSPTPGDFARADHALEVLRAGGRAGLDVLVRDSVHSADPQLLLSSLLSIKRAMKPPPAPPREPAHVLAAIRFIPG
jgi:superfamily II DNA or RNA helicase